MKRKSVADLYTLIEDDRQQRAATVLKDVAYGLKPMRCWRLKRGPMRLWPSISRCSKRRAKKGQCFQRPYLGVREFPPILRWLTKTSCCRCRRYRKAEANRDLGWMLHDIDFDLTATRHIFPRTNERRRIDVPPFYAEEVKAWSLASLAPLLLPFGSGNRWNGQPKVPPYGFSEEKIGWILVLDKDGRLKPLCRIWLPIKSRNRSWWVCRPWKRTSGIKPNFCGIKLPTRLAWKPIKQSRSQRKPFTPSENLWRLQAIPSWFTAKQRRWRPASLGAVFCKTGSLHISLPKICPSKCLMPTSHFLLKTNRTLSINAKPRKTLGRLPEKRRKNLRACAWLAATPPWSERLHPAIKGVFGGQSPAVRLFRSIKKPLPLW